MSKSRSLLQHLGYKKAGTEEDRDFSRTVKLLVSPCSTVDIEFRDITLKVYEGFRRREKKTILKGLSGNFKSGQLTAILGPSGAGKSSLLNALTGFSTIGVTGTIQAGNSTCVLGREHNTLSSMKEYSKKSCYILQDDRLNPFFTVAELMKFSADLKLGNCMSDKLKQNVIPYLSCGAHQVVDDDDEGVINGVEISDILMTLSLNDTANTRCGCLSGGQRKRLSVAVELIDNPPVIYLDEPTTGLDSSASAHCIALLKSLARDDRTIVCTIHQPSASVYALFDQVYIIADGMCIYNGSSENTVPYLASAGFCCPIYHNPADYILEVANCEYGNFNEFLSKENSRHDWTKKTIAPITYSDTNNGKSAIPINPPGELYKFRVLYKRSVIQLYRDWTVTHLKVAFHLIIGILLGLLYQAMGNDGSKTINNLGFIFVSIAYLTYTSLMPAVLRFPQELPVLKKENFNNWYRLPTYYTAVLVATIPVQVWFSIVYCGPSYILSGQPLEIIRFMKFVSVCSLVTIFADALGNIIGTWLDPINGTFIGAIMTCGMIVFSGFIALFSHMSELMQTLSYGSVLRYAFEAISLAMYADNRPTLDCIRDYCYMRYPKFVLEMFGFKIDNFWKDVVILISIVVLLRVIAFFTLRRIIRKSV